MMLNVLRKSYSILKQPIIRPKNERLSRCLQMLKHFSSDCPTTNSCMTEPGKWPTGELTAHRFHPATINALNEHLLIEFKAFYYYLSMANYFNRVDVALPGCHNYFLKMHKEEYDHSMQFINYINKRGGIVTLLTIEGPPDQDWKCPINAFKITLQLEMEIAERLESLCVVAKTNHDTSANDFITTNFIPGQIDSINEIAKIISSLSGIGDSALSRYLFDQSLLQLYSMKNH